MITNLLMMPACLFCYSGGGYKSEGAYTFEVWLLLVATGLLTLSSIYFTNLTFYYENAARGAAYSNFELIYTFFFDVVVMGGGFRMTEVLGAILVLAANLQLYAMKTFGFIS